MAEESAKRKQLLFVDDDPEFLSRVTAELKEISKGRWAIRTATNHSQAMEQLNAQPVETVVVDVEMPVMDGIEFLRFLGRTHPGQQVVMLTTRIDEVARKTSLDLGASLYLEKPATPDGFRALFSALDTLSGAVPQAGFRGVMQRVGLQDLLQMECLARKSSILGISTGNRRGEIYICDGEIVHAQLGQLQGEMALYGLLALLGGEFALHPFSEPPRRTITGQYQFLLMEAARLRDEGGPPAAAAHGPGRGFDTDFLTAERATPTEACGIRIEEVLLCSPAGEVLYQWKCEAIEAHLELFKKLEEDALVASKGTPSGRFHRLSMDTGNTRVLVQIQPTFKLLVRSALPAQAPSQTQTASVTNE
jgi:DNA-binding NarL/FixJ family response regulator